MVEHIAVWCAASLERYREKKATRQCGGSSKIRYQIRKTNADNRPRFKVGLQGSAVHLPALLLGCLPACSELQLRILWLSWVLLENRSWQQQQ